MGLEMDTDAYNRCLAAHGWVMTVGLGFFIPLGIVLAAAFRRSALWAYLFWIHVGLQVLGLLMGLAGAGLGAQLDPHVSLLKVHKGIGIAAVALIGLQAVVAIAWRPICKKEHRWLFTFLHTHVGKLGAALSIVAVFLGIGPQLPEGLSAHWIIAYAVVISVLVGLWLAAALAWDARLSWLRAREQGEQTGLLHKPVVHPEGAVPEGKMVTLQAC